MTTDGNEEWRETFEQIPDSHGQTQLWLDGSLDVAPDIEDVQAAVSEACRDKQRIAEFHERFPEHGRQRKEGG